MATIEIAVPNIGDFRDVPIVGILVKPGDVLKREDPIVELESDKATMEVPSPEAGTVERVIAKLGDLVSEGTALITLAPTGAVAKRAADAPPEVVPQVAAEAQPEQTVPRTIAVDVTPTATVAASAAAPKALPPTTTNGVVHASPSIRRFARELGVDLSAVRGTGPHARITRDDVAGFVAKALATPKHGPAEREMPFALPAWPVVDFAKYGDVEVVPLTRIAKLSGPYLHRNWVSIPHVTNNDEADITELEAFRKTLNAESPAAKVTMLAFVMKAVVAALRAHPTVNSSLQGETLVLKRYYNIGFAADTPQGLVVPVIAGVDRKGVLEIATETAALAAKARAGKLTASEMAGSTFTISSLGGIGGTSFTPIVNAPEVAILGVSRAATRPMWDGSQFVPRLMLPLSLSYDHRVIDGALAARFNTTLVTVLADLRRSIL